MEAVPDNSCVDLLELVETGASLKKCEGVLWSEGQPGRRDVEGGG